MLVLRLVTQDALNPIGGPGGPSSIWLEEIVHPIYWRPHVETEESEPESQACSDRPEQAQQRRSSISVAGGVSVQGPAVDTSLSSARNVALSRSQPGFQPGVPTSCWARRSVPASSPAVRGPPARRRADGRRNPSWSRLPRRRSTTGARRPKKRSGRASRGSAARRDTFACSRHAEPTDFLARRCAEAFQSSLPEDRSAILRSPAVARLLPLSGSASRPQLHQHSAPP